ncbi:MAG: 50S ribosomal protein L3 [Planctomycetaceae bacterium]|nr:50S ribosomal protein L3 [Planctomycetaceae bacterium]
MPVGLLGRKIGMTQIYEEGGVVVPVTVLELGPCPVLQVRTQDCDGYEAVQVGFGDKPRRLASRAERGHVAVISSKRRRSLRESGVELRETAGCEPQRYIREFRTDGEEHGLEVGTVLSLESQFELGARVDVIGTSKGRGTAGVMKRHNFSGQRATHGVKKVHRHGGSIGQSADPSRVLKGTKMAGHFGAAQITVRNLRIARLIPEENLMLVKGAVPGPTGGYVVVRPTNKKG